MLIIVQARLNSKRFPGKVLTKINGIPLLKYLINNLKKSNNKIKIVIATSKKKTDDPLVKFCTRNKIKFFRGDLNNVASRLLSCAKKFKANYFMRVCGDSPLIRYQIVDRAIRIHKETNQSYDLITNLFPRTFESGQSIEIIRTTSLSKNLVFFSKEQKEHVTKFFYDNHKKFMIKNFKNYRKNTKMLKMSVDQKSDLEAIIKNEYFKYAE